MPPLLILEGSCNNNQETSGGHLVSFHANSQTRNHIIQLLTAKYWPLGQQSNISAILAKVELYSTLDRSQTTCYCHFPCSAPILPRQQRHPAFITEFNVELLYLPALKNVVADFLSRPNQAAAGSVAATSAADPVDFEEMAAKQNRCPETQRLMAAAHH